jgi:hypothetical protein
MNEKQIEALMDEHDCEDIHRKVWDMINMRTQTERRAAFVLWLGIFRYHPDYDRS